MHLGSKTIKIIKSGKIDKQMGENGGNTTIFFAALLKSTI